MTEEITLRPSDRLRVCLMGTAEDTDEITLNRPAALALLDEVRQSRKLMAKAFDVASEWQDQVERCLKGWRASVDSHTRTIGLAGILAVIAFVEFILLVQQ